MIKAISLWQPWASLIAMGYKRYETRSWRTPYTGPIAIHAAKAHFDKAFAAEEVAVGRLTNEVPLGAIVATAVLVKCHRTEEISGSLSGLERHMGDYYPGRWAWELTDIVALPTPIPFRGAQGLFDIPDDVLREVMR